MLLVGGQLEQQAGGADTASDGTDCALPALAGADFGRELVAAKGAANIVSGGIAKPDDEQQKGDLGGAVRLGAQRGQRDESEAGIEQAEDGNCRVGHDALDRAEERAIDEHAEAEQAEDGGRIFRPLEIDGKENEERNEYRNSRWVGAETFGEAQVFPAGEDGDAGDGQRKEPLPPSPDRNQNEDNRDQNSSRKDSSHSGKRIHCEARHSRLQKIGSLIPAY